MAPEYLKHNYIETVEQALPSLTPGTLQMLPEAPFLRRLFTWGEQTPPRWASAIEDADLESASQAILESVQAEIHSSDVAAIVYTSGSTSVPKGIVHSQYSLLRQSIKQAHEKNYTNRDRIFSSMPFFWVGGLSYTLLTAMQAGATVLGCKSTLPKDTLDFIEHESATWFLGWPHAGEALEKDPSFAQRKLKIHGGYLFGALPEDQRPESLEAICNGLGMTETAGPHSCGHLAPLPKHLHGSFGRAAEGMEYRVVDLDSRDDVPDGEPGELLVRGDTLMLGMYKCAPATVFTADGWYPTRDLVIRREGHIFFQGRCDDVVKIRGANIAPSEVQNALDAIPNVTQSMVTGILDGSKQYLGAVLITTPGATIDLDAIPGILRGQLSAYKVPSVYASLAADKLPFRSSGKIDRQALIKLLQQKLAESHQ
jgi:acyl-CoA synthetase (AMP-forming)/AMP-acid ligase II